MFIATQCLPPPHVLEQTVTLATRLVSDRVTPIKRPTVCLNDTIEEGIAARAIRGAVFFRRDQWKIYAMPKQDWGIDEAGTVLHEVLHQVGLSREITVADLPLEEGATEAVTQDLLPTFTRRLGATFTKPYATYAGWVKQVRIASAAATGRSWNSPAGRRWRIALLSTPPAERSLG